MAYIGLSRFLVYEQFQVKRVLFYRFPGVSKIDPEKSVFHGAFGKNWIKNERYIVFSICLRQNA